MISIFSRLPGKVAGAAVVAVVAGLVLSDSEAHANTYLSSEAQDALIVNVRVGGLDYEVSTFTGSYNDNSGKFETAANGGVMPWWGSPTNAGEFASAVGTNLGSFGAFPAELAPLGHGPFFAYYAYGDPSNEVESVFSAEIVFYDDGTWGDLGWTFEPQDPPHTWAQASLVPAVPVPGPLPAVGLAVAFGFSRQLRKRIKASASNPPSASAEA